MTCPQRRRHCRVASLQQHMPAPPQPGWAQMQRSAPDTELLRSRAAAQRRMAASGRPASMHVDDYERTPGSAPDKPAPSSGRAATSPAAGDAGRLTDPAYLSVTPAGAGVTAAALHTLSAHPAGAAVHPAATCDCLLPAPCTSACSASSLAAGTPERPAEALTADPAEPQACGRPQAAHGQRPVQALRPLPAGKRLPVLSRRCASNHDLHELRSCHSTCRRKQGSNISVLRSWCACSLDLPVRHSRVCRHLRAFTIFPIESSWTLAHTCCADLLGAQPRDAVA